MASTVATAAALAGAALLAGCLQPARYPCEADAQCELDNRRGLCVTGWCAYEDDDCPSQLRWSGTADGALANECLPLDLADTSGGASSSSSTTSSSTTSAGCESWCIAGPHATAACNEAEECIVTCDEPWQDCDGDVATGCEVPVGVPHQCDAEGLDPVEGCWTAWCGASAAAGAVNFGTYYCTDCVTCQEPVAGECRWCDHGTGHWYATDVCSCSDEHLGAVCAP